MPLGNKPECTKCGTRETPLWHSTDAGNLCNACLEDERNAEANACPKTDEEVANTLKPTRRSTRITRYCNSKTSGPHKVVPKGKGRRNLFKKTVRNTREPHVFLCNSWAFQFVKESIINTAKKLKFIHIFSGLNLFCIIK